jgi:hypothetical protein
VERLRALQQSLLALPDLAPPAGAWERIVAAEQRTASASRRVARAFVGFSATAAAALLAVIYFVAGPTDYPATIVRISTELRPVGYAPLVAESARLERLLAEMPPASNVVRLGTISTIVGLEDQIALLDAQLSYGDAIGLAGAQRTALWSERVDLMNALILVRAAQDNVFPTVVGVTL